MDRKLKKEKLVIIFLGPQGSGKGTQAELLGKKLHMPVIEMGKLLRQASQINSVKGRKIKKIINEGKLLPLSETIDILKNEINKINLQKGFILDGFPRNLDQAKKIEKFKNKIVIYLSLSEKETLKRLGKRKTCSKCGKVFIDKRSLIKCSVCNGKLEQREDDKPSTIKKRLNLFRKSTKPVLEYYQKKNELININGEQSIDNVFKEILKKLGIGK